MKRGKHTLLIGLVVLLSACSTSTSSDDSQSSAPNDSSTTESSNDNPETLSIDGKAACEVVPIEAVAAVFDVSADAITSEAYRDKDDHKLCRYEIRYSKDLIASLFINIKYNDRQDVMPNQFSEEMQRALKDGLPVDGFKNKIQTFAAVNNLATQAAYSGNLPDNKNLIFRINEDYFIRLEYSRYEDGKDTGDYQAALVKLAKTILP